MQTDIMLLVLLSIIRMMANLQNTKPLYRYERSLDYKKHKLKLKQIQNKTFKTQHSSIEIKPWVKQNLKMMINKQNKIIEDQNQKLLSKLMRISNRNSMQFRETHQQRQNLYRKNWLKNIKKENQNLGEKLTNLRSSLQYKHFSKSIDDYEKIKKSMMINRKARLPILTKSNISQMSIKILKTEPTYDSSLKTENSQRKISKLQKRKLKNQAFSQQALQKNRQSRNSMNL